MKKHAASRTAGVCFSGAACLLLLHASPVVGAPQDGKKAAAEWRVPRRASRKKNPTQSGPQSIAIGKKVYEKECLSCHGKTGIGDGPAAKDLKVPAGNLARQKMADQTDGALYWKVKTGRTPMPSFATLLSKQERWHVINYIRTFVRGAKLVSPEFTVSSDHRSAVSSVVGHYMRIRESLARNNPDGAHKHIPALAKAADEFAALKPDGLDEKARTEWNSTGKEVVAAVRTLPDDGDLDALRGPFAKVSEKLVRTLEKFGHAEVSALYVYRCSKAFKDRGAIWVQAGSDSECPYLGPKTHECGQIRNMLGAVSSVKRERPIKKGGGI